MKKAYYIINPAKFLAEGLEVYNIEEAVENCFVSMQHTGYINFADGYYDIIDTLVGLQEYIPLYLGRRTDWRKYQAEESLNGFIFNARKLIEQGAFLGIENITTDYIDIVDDIIERVASTLSPRPPVLSDAQIDAFMKISINKDDPEMRAWLKQDSIDPKPDLEQALEEQDLESPGCRQVIEEVQRAIHAINVQKLLKGQSALAYLKNAHEDGSCQLFVWQQLSVSQAIGTIRQGKEIFL